MEAEEAGLADRITYGSKVGGKGAAYVTIRADAAGLDRAQARRIAELTAEQRRVEDSQVHALVDDAEFGDAGHLGLGGTSMGLFDATAALDDTEVIEINHRGIGSGLDLEMAAGVLPAYPELTRALLKENEGWSTSGVCLRLQFGERPKRGFYEDPEQQTYHACTEGPDDVDPGRLATVLETGEDHHLTPRRAR